MKACFRCDITGVNLNKHPQNQNILLCDVCLEDENRWLKETNGLKIKAKIKKRKSEDINAQGD